MSGGGCFLILDFDLRSRRHGGPPIMRFNLSDAARKIIERGWLVGPESVGRGSEAQTKRDGFPAAPRWLRGRDLLPPQPHRRFVQRATDGALQTGPVDRAAGDLAHFHRQHVVDGLPQAAFPPTVEVPLHRRMRREVLGQKAPLEARFRDKVNGAQDIPRASLMRPPVGAWLREMRFDQCPLFVRAVACIAQPIAPILQPRDFSPGRNVSPRCLRKHERIVAAEIMQQFSLSNRAGRAVPPNGLSKPGSPFRFHCGSAT